MSSSTSSTVNNGSNDHGFMIMNPAGFYIFSVKQSKKVDFKFYKMSST